jgi:hypothetical protein
LGGKEEDAVLAMCRLCAALLVNSTYSLDIKSSTTARYEAST